MDLYAVLKRAVDAGASDVHLKVDRPPIVRFDGSLEPVSDHPALTDADLEQVLVRVTEQVPDRLRQFLDSGDLDIAYHPDDLPRFRVNGFRQRGATSFAFRVIPKNVPTIEELNLPDGVRRLTENHRGLILVTGATGSGKTMTLAAMLDLVNRSRRQHIVTIEDPIEILHPDHSCIVNQRECARTRT